jgi:hypothetical protein
MGLHCCGNCCYDEPPSLRQTRPRLVMAVVFRSLHRWWVPLASIAGMMLSPVGASPHEVGSNAGPGIATRAIGDGSGSAVAENTNPDGCPAMRSRSDEQASARTSRSCTCSLPAPRELHGRGTAQLSHDDARENVTGGVAADPPAGGARPVPAVPLRSHKHPVVCPKFTRVNDPNDDGTSRDPSDDETSDDFAAVDGSDVPVVAWIHDTVRCSITLEAESASAWIGTPSAPSRSRHHLRC